MRGQVIEGDVDDGFGPVADALRSGLHRGGGSAVAIIREGRLVVDLWAGVADRGTGRPWTATTQAVVYSCTKGLMSIAMYRLVEEARVELDAPVARYWPGFAEHGKGSISVRELLTHRAGLPALDRTLTRQELLAWRPVIEAIEAQRPLWEPGTAHTYHAKTFGWLVGEVVRRVTGMSPGTWFRRSVADPTGSGARIGVPIEEQAAIARTEPPWPPTDAVPASPPMTELQERAVTMNGAIPFPDVDGEVTYNAPAIRAAERPGGNGIASARDLATIYGACVAVDPSVRLLSRASIDDALVLRSSGPELFGSQEASGRWGTGFMLDSPPHRPMLGPRSFGHDGAGGLLGFADDESSIGFGYVTNQMGGPGDDRARRLVDALRTSLGT